MRNPFSPVCPGLFSLLPRPAGTDPRLVFAATTRRGVDLGRSAPTVAAHAAAVRTLARGAGLDDAAWAVQVHGATVLAVERGGVAGEADALVTDLPGLALVGRTADCPLVLVAGPAVRARRGVAWGMAHASWRSTVQRIVDRLLAVLVERYGLDPARTTAIIGPSAGPCCYVVGPEVLAAARRGLGPGADRFFPRRGGRLFCDLWAAATARLAAGGVPADRIAVNGWCSLCRNDLFFSHRAEAGRAGRGAALVGLISGNNRRGDPVGSSGT